ncbi:MAG: ATP-binding protein [Syntrophales bacterium]|nr:ATP-binding protein [Syntrophales bacterium]
MLSELLGNASAVIPPTLGFIIYLSLSILSVIKGRGKPATGLFSAICFMGALINGDVALVNVLSDKDLALRIDRLTYVFFVFSPPVYIQFVHHFLGIKNRRYLEVVAYIASFSLLFFVPTEFFIKGFAQFSFGVIAQGGPAFHFFSLISALTVLYCLWTLYREMRNSRDNVQTNRIRYILLGLGAGSFLIGLNILPVSGIDFYPMGNFSFVPAIILSYGLLKYDPLDIGMAIRKGVIYTTLTLILTSIYGLFIFIVNTLFVERFVEKGFILSLALALFMVFLFNPTHVAVQDFIDRLFYRGKYDYQNLLHKISEELVTFLDLDSLKNFLLKSITEALNPEFAILFVLDEKRGIYEACTYDVKGVPFDWVSSLDIGHPLVMYLKTFPKPLNLYDMYKIPQHFETRAIMELFHSKKISLVIPLMTKNSLTGFLVLGQKRSGELYIFEDMHLLEIIANQCAIAVENAKIYEELELLNKELERKVEERTADLIRAQQLLIRSESLAAIGQLVAGTAHELNNPLASASSLVQSVLEEINKCPIEDGTKNEILDDLQFSLKELKRAAEIIRSLLSVSRQTQTYTEPVNLNVVLDDALRVLQNQIKNLPVIIEKHYETELPEVEGNFANLGQVFINIIKNAIESLPNGKGSVVLRTIYDRIRDTVVVECQDTGQGIQKDLLQEIFKPFFTTKPVGKGTGLGLYISHEIVRRHGGTIDVESETGKGTLIRVCIPCKRRIT